MYAGAMPVGIGVPVTAHVALAAVLERWRIEQKLEWRQLARLSSVSRGTLNNLRLGKSANSDTLRKIARGLATHPHTDAFDTVVHRRALYDLFDAAGLVAGDEFPRPDLRTSVLEVVGTGARADQVDAIVRELATLPPHLQDRWIDMARVAMLGIRQEG
jgi:transcriptional regulator with XRE-family HTH domain